jgi:hypothetical protein
MISSSRGAEFATDLRDNGVDTTGRKNSTAKKDGSAIGKEQPRQC